jgi:hypothetical protein
MYLLQGDINEALADFADFAKANPSSNEGQVASLV